MSKRLRVYVAGPYSQGDVAVNVREAIYAGNHIAHRGHIPFIPHLTHFWHMIAPHEYKFWLEQDMEWLKACDVVLRLPGESSGADKEVKYAQEHGMEVYYSTFEIPDIQSTSENIIE